MVGILGPRQCGKTTLARDYLAARTEPQIHYFDLEDPDHLTTWPRGPRDSLLRPRPAGWRTPSSPSRGWRA